MMSVPARAAVPPKTTWKPGKVRVLRANYRYTAQHDDELSFEEGDILYVYDQFLDNEPGWFKARCGNREGLVPTNYLEEQAEEIELPLHDAARRGNIASLKEYLKQGLSGTGLDAAGNTPLYWAARAGHLDCVKELLNLGNPAIDAQNKMGDTPLHVAACHGHIEVIKTLLENGANSKIKNKDGLTAEELSADISVKNVIQLGQRENRGTYGYDDDDYNDESD